jgi:hypothetical protein
MQPLRRWKHERQSEDDERPGTQQDDRNVHWTYSGYHMDGDTFQDSRELRSPTL